MQLSIIDVFPTFHFSFNNSVFLSERETADRNYALSYYMKENKCFPKGFNLQECLDFYFQVNFYFIFRSKISNNIIDFRPKLIEFRAILLNLDLYLSKLDRYLSNLDRYVSTFDRNESNS